MNTAAFVRAKQHDFNSIKVRLKLLVLTSFKKHTDKFQFHKGTIKTIDAGTAHYIELIFQFHKGTIKTRNFLKFRNHQQDFNSIKVRLKRL